jgi:DNA-binding transcriptional ArsR family regulator
VLLDPERVSAVLSPLRRRMLALLATPDSATGLAKRLDLPRQNVNYHLRELEQAGFLELVEERPRRGLTERMLRATSQAFLVNPAVLGPVAERADTFRDRFSSAYLIASAARTIQDVAVLRQRAQAVSQRLATATLETAVHFASPAELRAYTEDLMAALAKLAERYDRPDTPGARAYRVCAGVHPRITKTQQQAIAEATAAAHPLKEES